MRFCVALSTFCLACTVEAVGDGGERRDPQQTEETGIGSLQVTRERVNVGVEECIENGRKGAEGLIEIARAIQPIFSFLSDEAQEQVQQGVASVRSSLVNLVSGAAASHDLIGRLVRILVVEIEYRQRIATLQRERNDALRRNEELVQQIAALEREIKEKEDENEILIQQAPVQESRHTENVLGLGERIDIEELVRNVQIEMRGIFERRRNARNVQGNCTSPQ